MPQLISACRRGSLSPLTLAAAGEQFETVHSGQLIIQQSQLNRLVFEQSQRGFGIVGADDAVTRFGQRGFDDFMGGGVVINYENCSHLILASNLSRDFKRMRLRRARAIMPTSPEFG